MSQHHVEQHAEVLEVPVNLPTTIETGTPTMQTGNTIFIIGSVCILLKLLTELVKACKS